MARCEDCIHEIVCSALIEKGLPWNDGEYPAEAFCMAFQNKADVVPKSEEGAECPTCHGTGRIGTTDWLTKNITKEQLAKEKAEAIAEHEQHIKQDYAREIFAEIDKIITDDLINRKLAGRSLSYIVKNGEQNLEQRLAELKKKYMGGENNQ